MSYVTINHCRPSLANINDYSPLLIITRVDQTAVNPPDIPWVNLDALQVVLTPSGRPPFVAEIRRGTVAEALGECPAAHVVPPPMVQPEISVGQLG